MAMPPKDMMLALMPWARMAANATRIATGRLRMTVSDERTWNRKMAQTAATMANSSASVVVRLSMARSMSAERSYTVTTSTPSGRPAASSRKRAFTPAMVASAFSPARITTMPPTTSPMPFKSATPRLMRGPVRSSATSLSRMGTPCSFTLRGTAAKSSRPVR